MDVAVPEHYSDRPSLLLTSYFALIFRMKEFNRRLGAVFSVSVVILYLKYLYIFVLLKS